MGSKPSRVSGTLVATEGVQRACQGLQQAQTASAPATPEHPDGGPRASSPLDLSKVPKAAAIPGNGESQSQSDAWMPGIRARGQAEAQCSDVAGLALPGCIDDPAEASGAPAAAGPAPAAEGQAPLGLAFDRPLEEVLALATEAFGQIAAALPSPKWDRRVQALKGVGSVLRGVGGLKADAPRGNCRGLQLRDGPRCFRAACLILHIALRDKVLPVLLAAHELYRLTFDHGRGAVPEEEAHLAMATLLPHLLAKLGDLNIRLHESACAAVVFSAGHLFFGLAAVFARLKSHIEETTARGPQRMRVHAGVLDVVAQLVRRFPGRHVDEGDESDAVATWTPQDVRSFVVGGASVDGVTGARVQQAAAGLAVAICETLGKAAVKPMLEGMSPAAQEIVVSRLEVEALEDSDADGEDGEDGVMELPGVQNLCVMGVGLHPSAPAGPIAKGLTNDNEDIPYVESINWS
mmetsp:Transcript_114148/g.355456  ORF Transcript_114148/g.355456 Transcript_114148/m.355456 type:complete len:463 (+) Transcript_114148:61-1449(+)